MVDWGATVAAVSLGASGGRAKRSARVIPPGLAATPLGVTGGGGNNLMEQSPLKGIRYRIVSTSSQVPVSGSGGDGGLGCRCNL